MKLVTVLCKRLQQTPNNFFLIFINTHLQNAEN